LILNLQANIYTSKNLTFLNIACVMNVKCKSLYVRFYISILIFSNLYVEMVTVRFDSLPHCETNDRSQFLFSAYLSVPHSFEALNPNCDAISLSVSTVNYVYVSFCSNINPRFLLTCNSLEGTAVRRHYVSARL
jgi:hypothetical protein